MFGFDVYVERVVVVGDNLVDVSFFYIVLELGVRDALLDSSILVGEVEDTENHDDEGVEPIQVEFGAPVVGFRIRIVAHSCLSQCPE